MGQPVNVALIDYGVGNLHSLAKALAAGGAQVSVTTDWTEALAADALVLPGVGAFSAAVASLPSDPTPIRDSLDAGLPCLGICLGMQMLFDESAEGSGRGIGLIPGRVRRLTARVVPQMGWNDVETEPDPLFKGLPEMTAYFANSFVCEPRDASVIRARSRYGDEPFVSAVRWRNTWGVQFHPEKSSTPGLRLIDNFLRAAAALHTPLNAGVAR